jgi:hypothetical protein
MGLYDRAKKLFGYQVVNVTPYARAQSNAATRPVAGKKTTIKLVQFLQDLTRFESMQDEEMLEQLFIWDPAVGGALDRESTLIAQCYKGPYLKDTDKTTDPLELEMVQKAKEVSETMRMSDQFEMYGELLTLFGDVYVDVRDSMTYKVIPNKFVSLLEKQEQIGNFVPGILLTQANYMVFNEMLPGQFILGPGEFIHLKYKDTPVFSTDRKGRWTFGMYSVSPVQRAVISVWQMRITSIIDILYRWRMVPREIHSVDSTLFALDQFDGGGLDRLASSQIEANKYIEAYNKSIADQAPDQGYTVLDTIEITLLESKANSYMKTNELIDQLSGNIWTALNMPKSVVTGDGAGSYASELVISNYVSEKALQIAHKIKPMMLDNLRTRLHAMNSAYPVEKLDLKLELSMAATRLETFREMAIMGTLNCFTQSEIRERLGYEPLSEEQKKEIAQVQKDALDAQVEASNKLAAGDKNPETSHSSGSHKQDSGQQAVTKAEKPK